MISALPATGVASPVHREPIAVVQNAPSGRSVAAVARPDVVEAVKQLQAASKGDPTVLKTLAPLPERRNRLVGPPPTFEINYLQHLKETQADPSVQEDAEIDPASTPEDGAGAIAEPPGHGSYQTVRDMPGDAGTGTRSVNKTA